MILQMQFNMNKKIKPSSHLLSYEMEHVFLLLKTVHTSYAHTK